MYVDVDICYRDPLFPGLNWTCVQFGVWSKFLTAHNEFNPPPENPIFQNSVF